LDDASDKIEERLIALASAHDVLTRENWHSADITELVGAVAALHGTGDGQRFDVHGEACRLDPRRAVALSMALHELGTNAVKHGALSAPEGRVCVQWKRHEVNGQQRIELTWQERDGPRVHPPAQLGFGARLLERGLKHDLGGEVELAFEPGGLRYRVSIPPAVEAEAARP
ncbi:MAG: sensor histidine kinase, partial [Stenotrophomonas sp.]